jgi:hypothetical protein
MTDDAIPIVETYRGVGLHDRQTPERLEVVRKALDAIFDEADIVRLTEIAGDPKWPPEARLLAAAKLEAVFELAAEQRAVRPPIDLENVQARTAGLASRYWRDPDYYGSLLDSNPGGVQREQSLGEEI